MNTIFGRIPTIVVRPTLRVDGVPKPSGEIYIWLSDDDRRIILKLEAKVKIGTVIVWLREFKPGTPPESLPQVAPTQASSPFPGG